MLQEGFQNLISHDRISDLGRLHDLCVRVGAKKAVIAAFKSYVRNSGSEIVTDDSKAKEMIQSLLHLKARMDAVVAGAFHDNKDFNNSLRDAFETFMNRRAGRTAELLAKHLDGVLRGGGKSSLPAADAGGPTQEDQQEAAVDAALVLFRFLQVCICICLVGLFFGLFVCVCVVVVVVGWGGASAVRQRSIDDWKKLFERLLFRESLIHTSFARTLDCREKMSSKRSTNKISPADCYWDVRCLSMQRNWPSRN